AITGDRGLVRIHALREELREVDGHNFDLMQSANRLQSQLDRLETDAELERLARKQLLVRDGETLYQLADAAQRRARADTKHR
ncbi:MAG: septum formation initiator family protein, partial [Deltaproteobacteria bacterium]